MTARTLLALVTVLPSLWAFPQSAAAQKVDIKEWQVPWPESRPRDPFVAPDGRIWFVGQQGDYAAVFDPKTEQFKKFDLPDRTGPHNLIVDESGTVWFSGNAARYIGKLNPASGDIKSYPMPDSSARDPHTLTIAPDGALWFTVQGGNFIGRMDRKSGEIELMKPATQRARPYGIAIDSHGNPWVNLFGTNKLAKVDPKAMSIREIDLPDERARDRRIAITPDDKVWYTDYARGMLGMYDPASGKFSEWATPSGARSRPYAMTADDRGRIWLVETGPTPNQLVGFDPAKGEFFSTTEIESGGGAVRHMVYDPATKSIWFGTDTNTLGRALIQ